MVCGTDRLDQGLRNILLPHSGMHLQNKNYILFYSAISNTADSVLCPDDSLAPVTTITDQVIHCTSVSFIDSYPNRFTLLTSCRRGVILVERVVAQPLKVFVATVELEGSSSYAQELTFENYSEPL